MKNKKIIIITISLLLIILIILIAPTAIKSYKAYSASKRYEQIKKDIQEDIARVLRLTHPHCDVNTNPGGFTLDLYAEQNDYYGVDKKKLLDVDKKSYCRVRAKVKCVSKDKLEWNTYIKCKDYEDENYSIEK